MHLTELRDKPRIESILRRNTRLHLYEIGDLDDFFWPDTKWYFLDATEATAVALLYTAPALPVLVGLSERPDDELRELLTLLVDKLPAHIYSHLSGNLVETLMGRFQAESHGVHIRMCLTDTSQLRRVDTSSVVQLTTADPPDVRALCNESYPGNWFEPRMLETGCYFGIREGGELLALAGVHVYSARYRVAALGNVTTHPDYRGRGLAAATCARLCAALLETCDDIGLNVRIDNAAAIACYRKLGFTPVATFEEFDLVART